MIYEDDSHLIDDESIIREKMDAYRERIINRLSPLERLAILDDYKEFKKLYIEELCEEMAQNHFTGIYE